MFRFQFLNSPDQTWITLKENKNIRFDSLQLGNINIAIMFMWLKTKPEEYGVKKIIYFYRSPGVSKSWGIIFNSSPWVFPFRSWTIWGTTWWCQMDLNMMFQRCCIGVRSGEHGAQSMVSIPSSSRTACILLPHETGNSHATGGTHCTSEGSDNGSSPYLMAVRVPLSILYRSILYRSPSMEMPPQINTEPTTKQYYCKVSGKQFQCPPRAKPFINH